MTHYVATQTTTIHRRPGLAATLTNLLRNDARLIGRNSFLTGLIFAIIIMATLLRFGLPALAEAVAANPEVPFSVADQFPMLIGYIAIFVGAMVGGMVVGFIVLDERDDNTIKALLVTPLPLNYYIAYRIFIPMLIAFGVIITEVLIINQAVPQLWQLVVIAAAGSLTAPLVMLFFGTVAQNKVQGFAMNKIIGTLGIVVIAAWFVEPPLQYVIGLFPPYWFVKGYWLAVAGDANWLLALGIGVLYTSVVILFFVRRFHKVAYQ